MLIKGPDDHEQLKRYRSPFHIRALKNNMVKKTCIKFKKLRYLIHLFLKQLFYGKTNWF